MSRGLGKCQAQRLRQRERPHGGGWHVDNLTACFFELTTDVAADRAAITIGERIGRPEPIVVIAHSRHISCPDIGHLAEGIDRLANATNRAEEHTYELQSRTHNTYSVF